MLSLFMLLTGASYIQSLFPGKREIYFSGQYMSWLALQQWKASNLRALTKVL